MSVGRKQPLSWFKTNPQVRHSLTAMQEMIESLKRHGQLQDVAALADGTLIYGHRRLAAAGPAGLKELTAQVYEEPLTTSQIRVLQLTENIQRVDLTPYELAVGCRDLAAEGIEQKEIAKRLGKDAAWVSRLMAVWKCIPAVQERFKAGRLGITDCVALAAASEQEQHELLSAKDGGASRDEITRRVRKKRNGTGVRMSRVKCPMPSGNVVMISGEGLSLEDAIGEATEAIKFMKKAVNDGLDAKTFQAAMVCKTKQKGG